MWMVVSEDPGGRLRYQYHQPVQTIPRAPVIKNIPIKYTAASDFVNNSNYSRGCLTFPESSVYSNPGTSGTLRFHHPSPVPKPTEFEIEQYDNVNPDSSLYGYAHATIAGARGTGAGPSISRRSVSPYNRRSISRNSRERDTNSSGSTTSSSEYMEPNIGHYSELSTGSVRFVRGVNGRQPRYGETGVYYYSRDPLPNGTSQPTDCPPELPSPDYSPPMATKNRVRFHLPDMPVSRGEYVTSQLAPSPTFDDREHHIYGSVNLDPDPRRVSTKIEKGEVVRGNVVSIQCRRQRSASPTYDQIDREPVYTYFESTSSSTAGSVGSNSPNTSTSSGSAGSENNGTLTNGNSSVTNTVGTSPRRTPPPLPPLPPSKYRLNRNKKMLTDAQRPQQHQFGHQAHSLNSGGGFEITQAYGNSGPSPPTGVISRGAPPPPAFASGVTQMGTMVHTPNNKDNSGGGGLFGSKKEKKKKDKKAPRIRKEDISNPTNFQHKAHVGWDQDNGFSNKIYDSDMDETTKAILRAAGLQPEQMTEKDIRFARKFVTKNIDKYEPIDHLAAPSGRDRDRQAAPPPPIQSQQPPSMYKAPPVPISQPISQWGASPAPPPPPSRGASAQHHGNAPARPPPPPPIVNNDRFRTGGGMTNSSAPARPLPQVPQYTDASRPSGIPPPPPPPPPSGQPTGFVPPAPPPPPPMNMGAGAPPAPPPPPNDLSSLPAAQPGRGNLLAEIQAGKQLKSVAKNGNNSSGSAPSAGSAHGNVMEQIRKGAQLKHIDTQAEQEKRKSTTQMGGIAGALAAALEMRRQNMGIDDSSDEDESDDNKGEWSD